MKKYGCIGKKLTHSFSKEIHEKIADYNYDLIELTEQELPLFLEKREFAAVNVTIPYKQTVIPYLDTVSEKAKRIGAVNTIVNKNGKLYGYNTDYYGMKALIEKVGLSLCGKKVLILGTGGTAKTAAVVAADLGAKSVFRVSRQKSDEYITYSEATALHTDANIIINTTPVGMYPETEQTPIDISGFASVEGVIDAVYNPLRTALVSSAIKKGIKAEGGLYMLVVQAVVAAEKFLDTSFSKEVTNRIFSEILSKKENIVLTGMPGSGKSTVGKILAKSGYDFVDTDAEIEKKCGCSIKELIEQKGEQYFRDLETEVICEVSKKTGCVISTGGGAVLREPNVIMLKRNGKLFFINADLSRLIATPDRPLSNTKEKLQKLYRDRIEIYKSTADVIVADAASPEELANNIRGNKVVATFTPCKLSGIIDAPPSKSMAHRYLIGAALSGQKCTLSGIDYSEDILASIDCLKALGASVTLDNDSVTINPDGFMSVQNPVLECRESGSTLRFFMPLALCLGKEVVFRGSSRLFERPLSIYEDLCRENGFTFTKKSDSITVCGNLKSGNYVLRGDISSQFITGMILALTFINKESAIEILPPFESRPYVDLTISALRSFGADVSFVDANKIQIKPSKKHAFSGKIEGDYSGAAFLDAFNYIGSDITVQNLMQDSLQGDRVYKEYFEKISCGTPILDISNCPDLAPVLFSLAALHNGATFKGTNRLKDKESDRGSAMHKELSKLGGGLIFGDNVITVPKSNLCYKGEILYSHNDHRIVMALSVILSKIGGVIEGAEAVKKSYPGFFNDIIKLGAKVELK